MTDSCQFHHVIFVTKYSRIPSEEKALLRYYAIMETGKEALIFDINWSELIWTTIQKQAQKLWIKIIAGNVLHDHVHIIIDSNNRSISEIVQKLKGSTSYIYNRTFNHKGPVWAVWYSDTYLNNEKHLENAIKYIKNNHLKHKIQSNYVRWNI